MKYSFEIIANGMEYETVAGKTFSLHAITFRDRRDVPDAPDAYNDYFSTQPPDPMSYDDLAAFKRCDENRKARRKQWKLDVLDSLGLESGQVSHTGSEFFTAIEIKPV